MQVRPSSAPRFLKCPSSALAIQAPIGGTSPEAALGRAVHEGLALWVQDRLVSLAEITARHGLESYDTLAFLLRNGMKAWDALNKHFPNPRLEHRLESDLATGTPDVVHHDGVTSAVLDWKTGWAQPDYKEQLLAYAYAVRETYGMPESGVITAVVAWLRHGTFDVWEFGAIELDAFKHRMLEAFPLIGKEYAPGTHCQYCPRRHECTARQDYLRSAAAPFLATTEPYNVSTLTGLAMAYSRVKQLQAAIKHYEAALRDALAKGPLVIPGQTLEFETVYKDAIDPEKAWPVLSDHGFTDQEIAACVSMAKGAILEIAGKKATHGNKQAARAALLDELRAVGAVSQTVERHIRERPT